MSLEAARDAALAGKLYPAVILHGGDADDRRRAALGLGQALLCAADSGRPCGECRHCRRIAWPGASDATFHPDFLVLERDLRTVTSVEATKAFLRVAQVAPFEARGQVFVVAEAESLSGEAANALLKTLEEPHVRSPRHFFLLAPSRYDLLPTLRSRSLSVFLGNAVRWSDAELVGLVDRFSAAAGAYYRGGTATDLFAAAGILADAGDWKDPRAGAPWERAAAVVLESGRHAGLDSPSRRQLLELAAALLEGPQMRTRGITAPRILEGLVHRHLQRA